MKATRARGRIAAAKDDFPFDNLETRDLESMSVTHPTNKGIAAI
jgi:hypothetical protein